MKTRFDLVFKDNDCSDWYMTLHTSEPKSDEEIEDLIMMYAEICDRNEPFYSPVSIMDRLCDTMQDDGRDWYWTDSNYDAIEITGW